MLAQIAQVLGDNEISVKSVVQRGIGDDARLVMVVARVPRVAVRDGARCRSPSWTDLRSAPRAIRVIEKEFVVRAWGVRCFTG